jgi:molybdenum-dependent DNA-binding transcriptional regulator ModE
MPIEIGISYHNAWHCIKALKRKTERIIAELQNGEESDHPSQT